MDAWRWSQVKKEGSKHRGCHIRISCTKNSRIELVNISHSLKKKKTHQVKVTVQTELFPEPALYWLLLWMTGWFPGRGLILLGSSPLLAQSLWSLESSVAWSPNPGVLPLRSPEVQFQCFWRTVQKDMMYDKHIYIFSLVIKVVARSFFCALTVPRFSTVDFM